ncbi:MAG: hypothetical protein DRI39_02145 [Chloroflexi bacterium]|nr:MAG: hypothetical protein DRI39_02145 [Chloroflexota bacterium]
MTTPITKTSAPVHPDSKEQEPLEDGLRILARMIATAHRRRLGEAEVQSVQGAGREKINPVKEADDGRHR